MKLEEARQLAYRRGVEMRPPDPAKSVEGLFDLVDIADIAIMVLEEEYPVSKMPSRRHNGAVYEQWIVDQEATRQAVWEAFDTAIRGKPLKVLHGVQPAMH